MVFVLVVVFIFVFVFVCVFVVVFVFFVFIFVFAFVASGPSSGENVSSPPTKRGVSENQTFDSKAGHILPFWGLLGVSWGPFEGLKLRECRQSDNHFRFSEKALVFFFLD